ncbi:SDR family oxidoreductase [Mycobacterium tilburgii]|uniref:hypothetical protein n=1 Tax=Mycobacterium tilburgii TaxID=44467 RepID=UPI0011845E7F|nr:hypothetical protein [Mycobacterium tilburgii]
MGYAPLRMFADTSADDWFDVMRTNVISVHQLIKSCRTIPPKSWGSHGLPSAPIPLLSIEAVLSESLNAWRAEHPRFRFCCVTVGGTVPTEFTSAFDPDLLGVVVQDWVARGLLQEQLMTPEDVADVLAGVFASALNFSVVGLEQPVVRPPSSMRRAVTT